MSVREVTTKAASGMPVVVMAPDDDASHPAMIVMHERYGLGEHATNIARRLAENGYTVAAPDLYWQFPDQDALHAGDAYCISSDDEVVTLLDEAGAVIEEGYGADLGHLGVFGACATGRFPIVYGAQRDIKACVTFFGISSRAWEATELFPTPMPTYLDSISAPILGCFGEADNLISIDEVLMFRNALEDRNKTYQISVWGGMPHGWINDTMPGRYRHDEAEAVWAEMLTFLNAALVDATSDPNVVSWDFRVRKSKEYDFSKNKRWA